MLEAGEGREGLRGGRWGGGGGGRLLQRAGAAASVRVWVQWDGEAVRFAP